MLSCIICRTVELQYPFKKMCIITDVLTYCIFYIFQGVYFSDSFDKSANYCHTYSDKASASKFMFIAEVCYISYCWRCIYSTHFRYEIPVFQKFQISKFSYKNTWIPTSAFMIGLKSIIYWTIIAKLDIFVNFYTMYNIFLYFQVALGNMQHLDNYRYTNILEKLLKTNYHSRHIQGRYVPDPACNIRMQNGR